MAVNLSVDLAPRHPRGLKLENPVLAAAGTFGWGTDYGSLVEVGRLGAIVTNGTTADERQGADAPRVAEVPGGIVNAIGYPNPGINAVIAKHADAWLASPTTIIVNLVPTNAAEANEMGNAICASGAVGAVEVDITLALQHSSHPDYVARVVHTLKQACDRPVIVKLPPTGIDVLEAASRMEQVGVDALSVINTIPAMAIDVRKRQMVLASKYGGLSGPAVKAVALYFVWQVSQRVEIPVIGVGGISTAGDGLEFLLAGASAIQVGSASFRNPHATVEIVDGIASYLEERGFSSVGEIVGAVQ